MMKKPYRVTGNDTVGYRIAIPSKAKVADEYEIKPIPRRLMDIMNWPEGTLVMVPVVKQ